MRILIITMEDPLYTISFFKDIIQKRHNNIVALAIAEGDRMKIGKKRSKIMYLFTLLLIMGMPFFIQNTWKTLLFKIKKKLAGYFSFIKTPSLSTIAGEYSIPVFFISDPNSADFITQINTMNIDIIINQSQHILKKNLLGIPKIGTLNRHNALLPKNRGRLTPFWVLFKNEKETGVSIHFVNEGIDAGPILVQEKFKIEKNDTFKKIVEKNYSLASKCMLKALDLLEKGNYVLMENDNNQATVNSVPTFKDALNYRLKKIKSI